MKKIVGMAIVALSISACGGETGQREHQMQDNQVEAPTGNPNANSPMKDTSTSFATSDSSTVIGYDTSARRKN